MHDILFLLVTLYLFNEIKGISRNYTKYFAIMIALFSIMNISYDIYEMINNRKNEIAFLQYKIQQTSQKLNVQDKMIGLKNEAKIEIVYAPKNIIIEELILNQEILMDSTKVVSAPVLFKSIKSNHKMTGKIIGLENQTIKVLVNNSIKTIPVVIKSNKINNLILGFTYELSTSMTRLELENDKARLNDLIKNNNWWTI